MRSKSNQGNITYIQQLYIISLHLLLHVRNQSRRKLVFCITFRSSRCLLFFGAFPLYLRRLVHLPTLTLPDSETVVGFMDESGNHKRCRSDEDLPEISSPEAKRLRDDLLLDDDTDDDGPSAGNQDLASVMKSLEEEIAVPSSAPLQTSDTAADLPNLGYLFEATDDELGLPPPATISVSDESEEATEEAVAADLAATEVEELGYRQMWGIGYDDEINGYDAIEGFGFEDRAVVEADEDDVLFDGGLFDYADVVLYGSSVLPDVSWRSETEPAN